MALPAYSYVTQTLKVNGIPQNWIVGADGVIRLKVLAMIPPRSGSKG
jgi:hypothetical protein